MTYLEIIIGAALALGVVVSLSTALTHGLQLSRMARARTHVLGAAQAELERLREARFEALESHPLHQDKVIGQVDVQTLTDRRKRVVVRARHVDMAAATVVLMTDVYQQRVAR